MFGFIFIYAESHDNVEIAARWLKISREPWPDVLKNWDITYYLRQNTLMNNKSSKQNSSKGVSLTVCDYYEKWEVLSLPQGYTLVRIFL